VVELQEVSVDDKSPEQSGEPDALARARDFGIDITLLIENLKLTPTERLRKAQAVLESVVAFQAEVRAFRARQGQ
jgi:hypothetical protein